MRLSDLQATHFEILDLATRTEFIPLVYKWLWAEWGRLSAVASIERGQELFRDRLDDPGTQTTFIGLKGCMLLATASLKRQDMDIHPERSPWLASVFVKKEERNKGYGGLLVKAVENLARRRGHREIFLFTADAAGFYLRLGWTEIERKAYRGEEVSILRKSLEPAGGQGEHAREHHPLEAGLASPIVDSRGEEGPEGR